MEQQTATSEILRVIASSPTDLQPVFDAIVGSAARLCDATFAALHKFDGQVLTFDAQHGMTEPEIQESRRRFPLPPGREIAVGRAILDRRIVHIHDIRRDPKTISPKDKCPFGPYWQCRCYVRVRRLVRWACGGARFSRFLTSR